MAKYILAPLALIALPIIFAVVGLVCGLVLQMYFIIFVSGLGGWVYAGIERLRTRKGRVSP